VSDIQNPQIEVRCAWCDKENGVVPRSHYSHGICVMHRDRVLGEIKTRVFKGEGHRRFMRSLENLSDEDRALVLKVADELAQKYHPEEKQPVLSLAQKMRGALV